MGGTRKVRRSFLKYSLAPIADDVTISKIADIECAWIGLSRAREHGVILSFHGGAYVAGCARSCFPYLAPLCAMTRMAGCSVEYSLCPESLLPTPIDEGLAVYKFLTDSLGVDASSIVLLGDSAGASLVLLLIQRLI